MQEETADSIGRKMVALCSPAASRRLAADEDVPEASPLGRNSPGDLDRKALPELSRGARQQKVVELASVAEARESAFLAVSCLSGSLR